jgi:branched-chain amino acid transport system substrate-binding protein
VLALILWLATGWFAGKAQAQPPLKIGFSTSLTGPTAGGGKSALSALQIWREDVNSKGGILGRKVELIYYDDQNNPGLTPGIYAKLLDVDKVDLLIAPYGTVPTGPIVPFAKERHKLLMGDFSTTPNHTIQHDMWFSNTPWNSGTTLSENYFKVAKSIGVKTVAFLSVDQEFGQFVANGAKENARKYGMQTIYDQRYPANTVDFSSMMRVIRAAKPDAVFIASYPGDGAFVVRAINEIGVGPTVKMIGGGMSGQQYGTNMEALGSMLNGMVNFNTYVPEKTMDLPGTKEFLARYAQQAIKAGADPLGFYLAPFNYATGQMLEQAITATKSFDDKVLAKYLHTHEMKTIVGPIRYTQEGEWANPRVLTTQFRGIVDKNMEQFRQPGKQVILAPEQYKTGELAWPFEKAHGR